MLPLILLLVLPSSQGEMEGKFALQEEVDVLVYGTLQLSQALSDTYQSTTNKLQRAVGRQGRQEWTLERMREVAGGVWREEQNIREEVRRLQGEEREVQTLSKGIEWELSELKRGYRALQRRIHVLENGVEEQGNTISTLKAQADHHNIILQVVADAVSKQRVQMAKQRLHLRHILRQISTPRPS